MKISLNWLKDLVSWEDTPEELAKKLTSAGLNVEGIDEFKLSFPGVVIAKVVHREQHPDADRLSLCRVDIGETEPIQVVCGAPNVREGLTVLFATVGSVLPGNFKIKKSKIRGVPSFGMICSASELELTSDADGIMELETDLPLGTSADALYGYSDTVLDIEVTPNRPDWLSHLGVAREVAAIYDTKYSLPRSWSTKQSGEQLGIKIKIADYAECSRYTAFGAHEVKVGPSPEYMQNRLRAVGLRPINNVVDITNYVMLEMGQPMHAFDRTKVEGGIISIEKAKAGDTVVTLDEQERKLEADDLLVCDERGPIALAGVMGLANSEVSDETTELLLESAFFDPRLVRQTSRRLNLISDASYRFERGADWEMVETAAHRALYLLQEHAGARVVSDWADRSDPDHTDFEAVPLRLWQVNRLLGVEISTETAAMMLQNLGLKVQPMGNADSIKASAVNMMVKVPSFRRDLLQEVDLIEEIARSYGLDNMAGRGTFRAAAGSVRNPEDRVRERIRTWFVSCGFQEIVTSTFLGAGDLEKLDLNENDLRTQTLSVINPHHGGNTQLRTTMMPSLLDVARRNANAGCALPIRLFQVNRTYWPAGEKRTDARHEDEKLLPQESTFLQFSVIGWKAKAIDGVPADLLEVKGVIEALSKELRVPLALEVADVETWLEVGTQWKILDAQGQAVGTAGRVSERTLAAFELELPVAVAEINLDRLDTTPQVVQYEHFTRFPAVKRDLSLLVPEGVTYAALEEAVRNAGGPHLNSIELFDIYRGKGVSEGLGAYGIRLKFRSAKGNLKGKTVDRAIADILKAMADRLNIEPRS